MTSHSAALPTNGPRYRLPGSTVMLGKKVRHHAQHFWMMDHA
ncbi:MAG: hypothetical protein ABSD12_06545 [Paraburkholderia sp.]